MKPTPHFQVLSDFFLDGAKIIFGSMVVGIFIMTLLDFYIAAGVMALIGILWLIFSDKKQQ